MTAFIEWLTKLDQRKHARLFAEEEHAFLHCQLVDWPSKLVELATAAAFNADGENPRTVDDHLKQIAADYKDLPRSYDKSLLQRDTRY